MVAKIDKKIEQTLKYLKENSKEKTYNLQQLYIIICE